jgi:hypothetical protein
MTGHDEHPADRLHRPMSADAQRIARLADEDRRAPPSVGHAVDPVQRLRDLAALRDEGILDESEFEHEKAEALSAPRTAHRALLILRANSGPAVSST